MRYSFGRAVLASIAGAALYSTQVSAEIEVIEVTAQKRNELLHQVPIAMNVLAGDQLDDFGVDTSDDLTALFPNLSLNRSSAYNSGFAIRGVGTDSFHISGQQSVGIYLDEVTLVSPFVSQLGLFDLQRIEVLRGPQNTLYGRNTTGGAVNFYSNKASPGDDTSASVKVALGNGGLRRTELAVGVSLTDNLALRAAVLKEDFDGLWTNLVDGSDFGMRNTQGARISLVWAASQQTELSLSYSSNEREGDPARVQALGDLNANGAGTCAIFNHQLAAKGSNSCSQVLSQSQLTNSPFLDNWIEQNGVGQAGDFITRNTNRQLVNNQSGRPANDPGLNTVPLNHIYPYVINYSSQWGDVYAYNEFNNKTEFENLYLHLKHEFALFNLTSTTALSQTDILAANAFDLHTFANIQQGGFTTSQQELRLTSTGSSQWQWITGLYYTSQESQEDTLVLRTDCCNAASPPPLDSFNASPAILIDSQYDALSIYAQVDYTMSGKWQLSIGGRYSDDELAASRYEKRLVVGQPSILDIFALDRAYRLNPANAASPMGPPLPGQVIDQTPGLVVKDPTQQLSEFAYNLKLTYRLDKGLIYLSNADGFKGGAYDNRALANGENPIGPEFINATELGFKINLADNRIHLNGAVYYYRWNDIQLFDTDDVGNPAQINIPQAQLRGVELQLKYAPSAQFYMQASIGITSSEITDANALDSNGNLIQKFVDYRGNKIAKTPESTFNLVGFYSIPFNAGDLILQGAWQRIGERYLELSNSERSLVPTADFVNVRSAFRFGAHGQHEVALTAENLSKERTFAQIGGGPGVQAWIPQGSGFREYSLQYSWVY